MQIFLNLIKYIALKMVHILQILQILPHSQILGSFNVCVSFTTLDAAEILFKYLLLNKWIGTRCQ